MYSIQIMVVRVDDNGNCLTSYYDNDYAPKVARLASPDQEFIENLANHLLWESEVQIRHKSVEERE